MYQTQRRHANFLIIGNYGSGKTYGMQFAPGPVLIHSFDPGGANCIEQENLDSGKVIIDNRFEEDSAADPKAYRLWEKEFNRLKSMNMFEHIGTYVIDSWTRFTAALMHEILKSRKRKPPILRADLGKDPDIIPEMSDYLVHQKVLAQHISDIASLPCHTAILAHMIIETDDQTKRPTNAMVSMDGKKFAQQMPSLFDEVYFAESRSAGRERKYTYRLVPSGIFLARSRLRRTKVLEAREPQNLSLILKKAGLPWEDIEHEVDDSV